MDIHSIDLGKVIQFAFHLVPVAIAIFVWIEHEKFKKEAKKSSKKIIELVDENTKMTFSILKLLLFITIYLSIDTFVSLRAIQSDAKSGKEFSEKILTEISTLKDIKQNTDRMVTCMHFPHLDSIKDKFSPVLSETFSSYIEENAAFFRDGINDGKITFFMDRFPNAYIKSLNYLLKKYKHGQPVLMATSLAEGDYFWTHGDKPLKETEVAIKKYVDNGGYLKRIFFVDDNYQNDTVAMSILNRQIDSMHVNEVYVINKKFVKVKRYFVVNEQKQFMWEVFISSKETIDYGTYSIKIDEISELIKMYNEIENNPNIMRFRGTNK